MIDFKDLSRPFSETDIEWRVQRSGKKNNKIWAIVVAYVTNRAIMERLDEVVKPNNWKNEFIKGPDGGVLCGLSIKIENEWITKYDGAENTEFESIKGGLSGAMKRTAVQWGIGRYLYKLDITFAKINVDGMYSDKLIKKGELDEWYKWDPPKLPLWALPGKEKEPENKKEPMSLKEAERKLNKCSGKEELIASKNEIKNNYEWSDVDLAILGEVFIKRQKVLNGQNLIKETVSKVQKFADANPLPSLQSNGGQNEIS